MWATGSAVLKARVASATPATASIRSCFSALSMRCMATAVQEAAADPLRIDAQPGQLPPRTVPKSAKEYNDMRRQYELEVSALRKQFMAEWKQREAIEAAEVEEERRRIALRKAENRRLKAIRAKKKAAKHAVTRAKDNAAAQETRNYRLAARHAYFQRCFEKMEEWLDALEEDSKNWVTEDKIDEVINEDLFAMKYPPHLEEWYDRRERRRLRQAARLDGDSTLPIDELDEDELEGWGSDWEEDVPEQNWFGKLQRMRETGVQLEELYFEEPLTETADRMTKFYETYDRVYPPDTDLSEAAHAVGTTIAPDVDTSTRDARLDLTGSRLLDEHREGQLQHMWDVAREEQAARDAVLEDIENLDALDEEE